MASRISWGTVEAIHAAIKVAKRKGKRANLNHIMSRKSLRSARKACR